MALIAFQVLDKAIESVCPLGKKALIGSAKAEEKLLEELCQSGCLLKTTDRSPKYAITPHGREVWEHEARPGRRQQVKEKQRQTLIAFLFLVQKKSGKALTKTEQTRFPESLLHEAQTCNLVEPGDKVNSYRLLTAGEEMLLSGQPVEQQLQRLRELQSQMIAQWRSVHRNLDEELARVDGETGQVVRSARTELQDRGGQAIQAFDAVLAEVSAFPALLSAARRLQAEHVQLTELEARLRQNLREQREQLDAFERRMEEHVNEWSRQPPTVAANTETTPSIQPDKADGPSDASLWEATRKAAEVLKQETFRLGGIVKVPELTDAVRQRFPHLAPAVFHELLRKWQQEDRLTLQLCNDPRLEARAAEGIPSARGLLFYVQMR